MSETSPAAVVILAAGEGKRMKSRTPKVLHTLCGRTLLGHALAAVAGDAGFEPSELVVNDDAVEDTRHGVIHGTSEAADKPGNIRLKFQQAGRAASCP